MQSPAGHLRSVDSVPSAASSVEVVALEQASVQRRRTTLRVAKLGLPECALGFGVFVLWLGLFGGGILVDTEPYRQAISPDGAARLSDEGRPAATREREGREPSPPAASPSATQSVTATNKRHLLRAWLVVLTCFLPLNLAWLCLSASTLGAVGNLANLSDDGDPSQSPDLTNPYMSAVLRGFFVYLFLMSGLLVLDNAPFSNAGPSQYIRLAGFLSLFSFVVSYQPRLFGSLLLSAFERIQFRAGDKTSATKTESKETFTQHTKETTAIDKVPSERPERQNENRQ